MKKLLLILLLFCMPLLAQQKTTVTGTVLSPSGAPVTGKVTVTNAVSFVSSDGYYIAAGTKTVASINLDGTYSVSLIPNADSTPALTYYEVTYALSGNYSKQEEYWVVPATGPVTVKQVVSYTKPQDSDPLLSQVASQQFTLAPGFNTVTLSWPQAFADSSYTLSSVTLLNGSGDVQLTNTVAAASGLTVTLYNAADSNITITLDASAQGEVLSAMMETLPATHNGSSSYTLAPGLTTESLPWSLAFADNNYTVTGLALLNIDNASDVQILNTSLADNGSGLTITLYNYADTSRTVKLQGSAVHQ